MSVHAFRRPIVYNTLRGASSTVTPTPTPWAGSGHLPPAGGTHHQQMAVQVRPARTQTSRAPSVMDTRDAFGSLPESGVRTAVREPPGRRTAAPVPEPIRVPTRLPPLH